ncbi:MAG: VOC family protein [Ferruginibacter sp.]|nr:VOC family protein [Ferruginibacter sp.]
MKKAFSIYLLVLLIIISPAMLCAQAVAGKIKPALNHIALYVVDLKKSTSFYQQVVQLDTIPEPFHDGRHTWFSIGTNCHLHLIQGAKGFSVHEKHNHLCFTVSSVADFIKILDTHHVAYENLPGQKMQVTKRVDGVNQIYFKDPDGYWIEINDAKY